MKPSVLCSETFPVAKSLKIREGEYQGFPSKSFCLTVPKVSQGRPSVLCFRKLTVAKEIMRKGGESCFSPENFLSHSAENFPRRESFGVPLTLGIEKVSIRKGGERIKVFCQKKFCLRVPKNFEGNPSVLCFRNFC